MYLLRNIFLQKTPKYMLTCKYIIETCGLCTNELLFSSIKLNSFNINDCFLRSTGASCSRRKGVQSWLSCTTTVTSYGVLAAIIVTAPTFFIIINFKPFTKTMIPIVS